MRLSRIFQRKSLVRLTANLACENQVKKLFGHLQHVCARCRIMDHGRAGDPQRTLDREQRRIDHDGTRAGAIAHQRAAWLQAVERRHQRVLADRVIDYRDAFATGDLAHPFGDILPRGHDRVGTAMRARDLGFLVRADRPDHGDAECLRPLAGDQAHTTRRRVVKDRFATFKRVNLSEQILRRHPLHHQGRCSAVRDTVRQGNQYVRRHDTDVRVGALRPQQVADTVTYPNVGHPRTHGLDHTDRIRAQAVRQGQRVAAGAKIDVDEVYGDVRVPHARLARPWLAYLRGLELEDLRSPGLVKADGAGHMIYP